MPYIVTTKRPGGYIGAARAGRSTRVLSRHAVATLEEARQEAYRAATSVPGYTAVIGFPTRETIWADLPESGGTIGPLPDGTLIEVEQTTRRKLWECLDSATQDRLRAGRLTASDVTDAEIIDAFNALDTVRRK